MPVLHRLETVSMQEFPACRCIICPAVNVVNADSIAGP